MLCELQTMQYRSFLGLLSLKAIILSYKIYVVKEREIP